MNKGISIPATELKTALAGLAKVIRRRSSNSPQSIRIARDRAGVITLQSTDLDTWASYQLEAKQSGAALALAVEFAELNRIVKPLHDDVSLTFCRGKVEKSGQIKLDLFQADAWPEMPVIASKSIMLPPEFKIGLREALQCVSADPERYEIACVFLDASAKGSFLVGTDGKHLYARRLAGFPHAVSIQIPNQKFLRWQGFEADGDWHLTATRQGNNSPLLKITSAHWCFISKLCEVDFPKWRHLVSSINARQTSIKLLPATVESLLRYLQALPVGKQDCAPVSLESKAGRCVIGSDPSDAGNKQASIVVTQAKVTGKPIKILVNRNFLVKALRFGLNRIAIVTPDKPIVFSHAAKTMLVMPLRPRRAEKSKAHKTHTFRPGRLKATRGDSHSRCRRAVVPLQNPQIQL